MMGPLAQENGRWRLFPICKQGRADDGGKHSMRAVGVLCLQLFNEGNAPEITDDLLTISTKDPGQAELGETTSSGLV